MREDLNKLLCERERPHSYDHYTNYRHLKNFESQYDQSVDDEDFDQPFTGIGSGSRESMKFRYGWNTKPFNENLNPLWGWVRKQVGRNWDKCYSELCESFDKRSVINQHILTHLFQHVELGFYVENGELYINQKYRAGPVSLRDSNVEYYVDPRDGILKRNKYYRGYKQAQRERAAAAAAERAKVFRKVDEDTELHLIDGSWFEIKFKTIKGILKMKTTTYPRRNKKPWVLYHQTIEYPYTYDVLEKQTVARARVAVAKRTLSHKELKQYSLVA